MPWRAKVIVTEPFEAYEEMEGELRIFPPRFRADDGRIFTVFPDLGNVFEWLIKGQMDVWMKEKRTGEWIRTYVERVR